MKLTWLYTYAHFLLCSIGFSWCAEQQAHEPFNEPKILKIINAQEAISKIDPTLYSEHAYKDAATGYNRHKKEVHIRAAAQCMALAGSAAGSTTRSSNTHGNAAKPQFVVVLGVAGASAASPVLGTALPTFITGVINTAAPVALPVVAVGGVGVLTYTTIKHGPKSTFEMLKTAVKDFFCGPKTLSARYRDYKNFVKQQERFIKDYPDALYFTVLEKDLRGNYTAETYLANPSHLDLADYYGDYPWNKYHMPIQIQTIALTENVVAYNGFSVGDVIGVSKARPLIAGYDAPSAFRAQQAAEDAGLIAPAWGKGPCIGKEPVNQKPSSGCGQPAKKPEGKKHGCGGDRPTTPDPLVTPLQDPNQKKPNGCGGKREPEAKGDGIIRSDTEGVTQQSEVPVSTPPQESQEQNTFGEQGAVSEESIQGAVVDQILADAAAINAQEEKSNEINEEKDFFNFTNTAGQRMEEKGRKIPIQTLKDIIQNPIVVMNDPRGSDARMYYARIWKNGKEYNTEVLYDKTKNLIMHFLYTNEETGPLPKINKL